MQPKEMFTLMAKGEKPSRIPFVPTIYEHAARVINKTPSQVAADEDLVVESQLAGYELYKHDLISVGVDIYNVEYEALGAKVEYHENEELPSIDEVLVDSKNDLERLRIPDPESDGRMPLFLNAAQRINRELGQEVIVNGTVVGPFTLAAIMRGFENFIMDMVMDLEFAVELMDFAKKVSLRYAESFIKRGVGLSINESWIAPPLLSPNMYESHVMNMEKDMILELKSKGLKNVALISGGNTTPIAQYMIQTGTSLLLADADCDQEYYKEICAKNGILLRASIASKILETGTEKEMRKAAKKVIGTYSDYSRFIFGCGVVSYGTAPDKLLQLKRIVNELS